MRWHCGCCEPFQLHCPGEACPQSALVAHDTFTDDGKEDELGGHVPFAAHTWPFGQSVPGIHAADEEESAFVDEADDELPPDVEGAAEDEEAPDVALEDADVAGADALPDATDDDAGHGPRTVQATPFVPMGMHGRYCGLPPAASQAATDG